MAARKPFLLRTDPEVFAALHRWAADELRSVNGQIDFILRRALQQAGRLPSRPRRPAVANPEVPAGMTRPAATSAPGPAAETDTEPRRAEQDRLEERGS